MKRLLLATLLLSSPAKAAELRLVNRTGDVIVAVATRPAGRGEWRPLAGVAMIGNGARWPIQVTTDSDCAFDIRTRLGSGRELVYPGVNLCETSVVTLNRRGDGTIWVDYD